MKPSSPIPPRNPSNLPGHFQTANSLASPRPLRKIRLNHLRYHRRVRPKANILRLLKRPENNPRADPHQPPLNIHHRASAIPGPYRRSAREGIPSRRRRIRS